MRFQRGAGICIGTRHTRVAPIYFSLEESQSQYPFFLHIQEFRWYHTLCRQIGIQPKFLQSTREQACNQPLYLP